ncbi:unnamed protein product, partial [Didymodactylos carnosus]
MIPCICTKCTELELKVMLFNTVWSDLIIKPNDALLTRDQYRSFIASCTGQSDTKVISWRTPQQTEVPENDAARVTIERQTYGLRLRIRNLTIEDQGKWECVGANMDGIKYSKQFQMNIKVPITFHGDSIQYAPLGQQVTIKCRVHANPSAEVSWFKGQDKTRIGNFYSYSSKKYDCHLNCIFNIVASQNYEKTSDGLRINRVDMADNGTFWCRADVLETGESRDFEIIVVASESVTHPRIQCSSPCAIEKKTATLVCEASGLPATKYQWFYGNADKLRAVIDSPVGASEVPKFVVRGNQLTINYVDETDNGKYTCHASNDYDKVGQKTEYILNVIVPPRLTPIPEIEIELTDRESHRAVFQCRVERGSAESLSLEWQYMNNTPIQFEKYKLIELRFDPIRREHFGNYSCVAKNLADTTFVIASLLVRFPPLYIGPNIQAVSSIPGYRAVMKCQFESYPAPVIQWIKMIRTVQDPEGRLLTSDIDHGVNDITTKQIGSTLWETILSYTPDERDFGLSFECRALNPKVGRHSITLQKAEPPRAVYPTEAKPLANAIELVVSPPETGGLPLVNYIVKYEQIGVNQPDSIKTLKFPVQTMNGQQVQTLRIDNLQPSTSYNINILAETRAGIGQAKSPIRLKTLDRQIPQFKLLSTPPEEQSCMDDRKCLVKWSIESDGGAPI